MTALSFVVPGEPRGKGRPRIGRIAGHARMIPDSKTVAYESLVAHLAHQALAGRPPFDGAVDVAVLVHLTPPASTSKGRRAAMLSGAELPAKRPDLDNVVKAVLDGLNTVAFRDDAQVVSLKAQKGYAETPGVLVTVKPA